MKKAYLLLIFPAVSIVILDQISKLMVSRSLSLHDSIPVIAGFFNLVQVRNRGMAFGMMNRPGSDLSSYILIGATLIAIGIMLFWFGKVKRESHRVVIGLSLVLGGALGNLIDRIRLGEVIDFLDFYVGPYHWPAFNVADSTVTIGTVWLAACILFVPSDRGEKKKTPNPKP